MVIIKIYILYFVYYHLINGARKKPFDWWVNKTFWGIIVFRLFHVILLDNSGIVFLLLNLDIAIVVRCSMFPLPGGPNFPVLAVDDQVGFEQHHQSQWLIRNLRP